MGHLFLVAAGGAAGAAARHLAGLAALRLLGPDYPYGTLAVNLAGCFAMGVFIEAMAGLAPGMQWLRLLLATGFLGGFTTFSAFSLDFAVLWERGEAVSALAYAVLSVAGSLLALFAGLALVRALA